MSSTMSSQSESVSNRTNLIINYLPQTMTDENFRVLFAKYGDIRSARIIRNKNSGYSYGFGFVEYFNTEDAEVAINNLNGVVINNKKIKVSYARPSSDEIKNANIYVTNLPSTFTEREVRDLFAECGDIIQCRLLGNRAGTAFVLFNLHEEARQAIFNFDRKLVPGTNCRMKVKFATNEPNKKMAFKEEFTSSPSSYNNNNINLTPKIQKRRELMQPTNNNTNNNHPNRIASSGPIRTISHHHNRYNPLSQAQFHVSPTSMDDPHQMLYPERNHHSHHHHHHNAHHPYALKMGHESQYFSNNTDPIFNIPPPTGGFNGTTSMDPSAGGSAAAGEYILFVYNIGPETDEFHLGKLFAYYGQVLRVNVIRKGGPSGEGRGYGFVTMKFYHEALNAIANLDGYKFVNNRPLQVSFKRI